MSWLPCAYCDLEFSNAWEKLSHMVDSHPKETSLAMLPLIRPTNARRFGSQLGAYLKEQWNKGQAPPSFPGGDDDEAQ